MSRVHFIVATAGFVLAMTGACRRLAGGPPQDENQGEGNATSSVPPGKNVSTGDIVARVGNKVITVEDLQEQINRETAYTRLRYSSPEKRKEYLENVVRVEILAMEAKKRGFGNDPDIIRMMKQQMVARLIQKDFEPQHDPSQIPEQDIRAYWESHQADFNEPEQVDAAHILLADEATANKVLAMVRMLKKNDDKGFAALVNRYSNDVPSKQRAGELGFFARDATRLGKAVIDAAFDLKEAGAVAGPVQDDKGFHILRFIQRKPAVIRTYEQAAPHVRVVLFKTLRTDALKVWVAELRGKTSVKVVEENLSKVRIDTSNAPGATDPSILKYAPQVYPGMADQESKN